MTQVWVHTLEMAFYGLALTTSLPLSVESSTVRNEDLTEFLGTIFQSPTVMVISLAGPGSRTSMQTSLGQ